MKKVIAVAMAILFVLSLASCTSNKERYDQLSGAIDYLSKKLDTVIELAENNSSKSAGDFSSDAGDGEFIDDGGEGDVDIADDSSDMGDTGDSGVVADSGNTSSSSSSSSASSGTTKAPSNSGKSTSSSASDANTLANAVKKYVAAAKATDKNVPVTIQKTLKTLNGGDGGLGSIISSLEGVAKKVLADHSGTEKGVRGNLDLITTNDFNSYKMSNDGTFTTINFAVKDYSASSTGRTNEGSVGHVVGVLDTLAEATEPMGMETVGDTSNIKLNYTNAKVTCKINNKTGKIVSAKWEYDVDVKIPNNKVKFKGIPLTLKNASVLIHYQATLG